MSKEYSLCVLGDLGSFFSSVSVKCGYHFTTEGTKFTKDFLPNYFFFVFFVIFVVAACRSKWSPWLASA